MRDTCCLASPRASSLRFSCIQVLIFYMSSEIMCKIKPLEKMVKVGFPCQTAQWHLSGFASVQVLTRLWMHPLADDPNALNWGTHRFQRNWKSVQLYLKNYFRQRLHVHNHIYLWETVKVICHFPPDDLSWRIWFQCWVQSDWMWTWCRDLFS